MKASKGEVPLIMCWRRLRTVVPLVGVCVLLVGIGTATAMPGSISEGRPVEEIRADLAAARADLAAAMTTSERANALAQCEMLPDSFTPEQRVQLQCSGVGGVGVQARTAIEAAKAADAEVVSERQHVGQLQVELAKAVAAAPGSTVPDTKTTVSSDAVNGNDGPTWGVLVGAVVAAALGGLVAGRLVARRSRRGTSTAGLAADGAGQTGLGWRSWLQRRMPSPDARGVSVPDPTPSELLLAQPVTDEPRAVHVIAAHAAGGTAEMVSVQSKGATTVHDPSDAPPEVVSAVGDVGAHDSFASATPGGTLSLDAARLLDASTPEEVPEYRTYDAGLTIGSAPGRTVLVRVRTPAGQDDQEVVVDGRAILIGAEPDVAIRVPGEPLQAAIVFSDDNVAMVSALGETAIELGALAVRAVSVPIADQTSRLVLPECTVDLSGFVPTASPIGVEATWAGAGDILAPLAWSSTPRSSAVAMGNQAALVSELAAHAFPPVGSRSALWALEAAHASIGEALPSCVVGVATVDGQPMLLVAAYGFDLQVTRHSTDGHLHRVSSIEVRPNWVIASAALDGQVQVDLSKGANVVAACNISSHVLATVRPSSRG